MNYPPECQAISRNSSHLAPQPQRFYIAWQKRLSLIALTLGCLLLINAALFAGIAHATPTPEPPDTPTSAPTSVSLPATAAPTPAPTQAPVPPRRSAFAWPPHLGLAALAFGSLLVSTVLFVRMPIAKARRRDEHDE